MNINFVLIFGYVLKLLEWYYRFRLEINLIIFCHVKYLIRSSVTVINNEIKPAITFNLRNDTERLFF